MSHWRGGLFSLFSGPACGVQWFGFKTDLQPHQWTPASGKEHTPDSEYWRLKKADVRWLQETSIRNRHLKSVFSSLYRRLPSKSQTWSGWRPGETPSTPPRGTTWSVNACRSASPTPPQSAASSPSPARQPTSSLLSSLTRRYTCDHAITRNKY